MEVLCTFIEKVIEEWNDDDSYMSAKDIVYGHKMTNDIAEKSIQ